MKKKKTLDHIDQFFFYTSQTGRKVQNLVKIFPFTFKMQATIGKHVKNDGIIIPVKAGIIYQGIYFTLQLRKAGLERLLGCAASSLRMDKKTPLL